MATTACVICGTDFQPVRKGHKICSDQCRRKARGYSYRKTRQEALYRDDYKCRKCEAEHLLECHHLVPLAEGGSNELSNLLTLCHTCHVEEHRRMRAEEARQMEEREYGFITTGGEISDRAA